MKLASTALSIPVRRAIRSTLIPGGGWRLATGAFGFCTTNGACAIPRKPAPWPGLLIAMQCGRSKFSSRSPSSTEQTEPKLGCTTVGFGAYPVCIM